MKKYDSESKTWNNISTSSSDSPLRNERDTEDLTLAQAHYDNEKDEIANKEEQLDLEMNMLETELSSVQTELESVKKLIGKGVEKFKMFDA